MRQFIGSVRDDTTVQRFLVDLSPPAVREAWDAMEAAELALMETDDERGQMAYAHALAHWGDVGGYEAEVTWDTVTVAALGIPYDGCKYRELSTLSGGEQKRLALEALLRGPDEVLLLDEPDNYLDVPGKRWLEERLLDTRKTVLFVSHDRELLARVADRVVTVEGGIGLGARRRVRQLPRGPDGAARAAGRAAAALGRGAPAADRPRAHPAAAGGQLAGHGQPLPRDADPAGEVRGRRAAAGPPAGAEGRDAAAGRPHRRARGHRRAAGADRADAAVRRRDLLRRPGRRAGRQRRRQVALPAAARRPERSTHTGEWRLGARVVPGFFAQTHAHPEWQDRTPVDLLWHGEPGRPGVDRGRAMAALRRYGLADQGDQQFRTLSGGQQARFQILLLELSGATLLLLDEPTDNLDVLSAEALEEALAAFDGTVLAVTHDRWFARSFDRFLVFGADGAGLRVRPSRCSTRRGSSAPAHAPQRAVVVADTRRRAAAGDRNCPLAGRRPSSELGVELAGTADLVELLESDRPEDPCRGREVLLAGGPPTRCPGSAAGWGAGQQPRERHLHRRRLQPARDRLSAADCSGVNPPSGKNGT